MAWVFLAVATAALALHFGERWLDERRARHDLLEQIEWEQSEAGRAWKALKDEGWV